MLSPLVGFFALAEAGLDVGDSLLFLLSALALAAASLASLSLRRSAFHAAASSRDEVLGGFLPGDDRPREVVFLFAGLLVLLTLCHGKGLKEEGWISQNVLCERRVPDPDSMRRGGRGSRRGKYPKSLHKLLVTTRGRLNMESS
jgi:hypothetical protein